MINLCFHSLTIPPDLKVSARGIYFKRYILKASTMPNLLTIFTFAFITMLAGCSIWPKALTFTSEPESAQEVQVPVAATIPPPIAAAPAPAPEPVKFQPLPAAPATPIVTVLEPQTTAAPQPARATSLVPGYYINAGLFSVPSNGSKAYKKLEGAGLPVFSDNVVTKKGTLTRLRVGPYPNRDKANAAVKQIRTLKLDANVFRQG
jgi:general secretion pathway protein D